MRGDTGYPVRIRFAKHGKVRFVSHRDVARAFERAFRIEQLPLSFTQGFSPRPKVSFGLALSVGYESDAEYLDVELSEACPIDVLPDRLTAALPEGIAVTAAVALADRAPALQEAVTSVEYLLKLNQLDPAHLKSVVDRAWTSQALPITTTRKGKRVDEDIRPSLRRLAVDGDAIDVEVATKPRGVRPGEVVTVLRELADAGETPGEDPVLRTCQWIERDGMRLDPIIADRRSPTPNGVGAPALEVCA
jgi:radical SAM-linked protein